MQRLTQLLPLIHRQMPLLQTQAGRRRPQSRHAATPSPPTPLCVALADLLDSRRTCRTRTTFFHRRPPPLLPQGLLQVAWAVKWCAGRDVCLLHRGPRLGPLRQARTPSRIRFCNPTLTTTPASVAPHLAALCRARACGAACPRC